jgi:hypothetical protein
LLSAGAWAGHLALREGPRHHEVVRKPWRYVARYEKIEFKQMHSRSVNTFRLHARFYVTYKLYGSTTSSHEHISMVNNHVRRPAILWTAACVRVEQPTYICIYIYICIFMSMYTYTYIYMFICIFISMYTFICLQM